MTPITHLSEYRNRPRFANGIVSWGGDEKALSQFDVRELAEACHEVLVYRVGTWARSGFILEGDGESVTLSGWDFERVTVTVEHFDAFALKLAESVAMEVVS